MPENAIYLQAAFAITILALAAYVGYTLVRLRQAQDELRSLRQRQRQAARPPQSGPGNRQPLRSAQEPPLPR